uniref:Uncharacterized protein n=1 Tax=Kalanchoe fedtschenkoi TaxID=63787 RepID=A0A7N0ZQZ7_KALFE
MGKKRPCCEKNGLKKGPWSLEEDQVLISYVSQHGHGRWRSLPKLAGLLRCGKSCRLRWTNYLRPDIKRAPFTEEEEKLVTQLHGILGNRWTAIAAQLPGRTDNEIKNLWNTHLRKRLLCMGIDPLTHEPFATSNGPALAPAAQWESARLEAESLQPGASSDHFLRLWNSEVGEAFRLRARGAYVSSTSSIKGCCDSDMASTPAAKIGKGETCTSPTAASSSSDELDDSSDSALQLLTDYAFDDDMSFLADHISDYYSFPSM